MRKCPFCHNTFNDNKHYYDCSKKPHEILHKEARFQYIIYNFPLLNKETLFDEYVNQIQSLPDIKRKYGISFKATVFLLDYYGIPKRTSSESAFKITTVKGKKTCIERYGLESTFSRGGVSFNKRKEVLKRKYNVENSFQIPAVIKEINNDENWIKKYGKTRRQKRSEESKLCWANKTTDGRIVWLEKSLFSKKCRSFGSRTSSLEKKVSQILVQLNIPHEYQFTIKVSNKKRYVYDYMLKETNIIIEANGDYWHANPLIYNDDDVFQNMHKQKFITAKEIWELNKIKIDLANKNGHSVVVVWEAELKNKNDGEVEELIVSKIKEVLTAYENPTKSKEIG
jgi:G:T-mismatch repair DNA endonuclease (very short patch repair protein)